MISILFARTYEGELKVIAGPGDLGTVNDMFKDLVNAGKENADYEQIFLHELTLTGGRKQFSFLKPEGRASSPSAPPPGISSEELSSEELLAQMTIEDLKKVGDSEGIDLTGCKLKADFLAAIVAWRKQKKQESEAQSS